MQFAFKTDKGQVRQHNEDNGGIFVHEDGSLLAIVADGMGGHQAGDIASKMTKDFFEEGWGQRPHFSTPMEIEKWMEEELLAINQKLYQHALQHPECQGMGTTVVMAVCTKTFVTIGHIGDSRGYVLNSEGFIQKTADHSLVNELVRTGQITTEEAESHPRRNVLLRALGTELSIKIDITTLEWEQGNYLLLCSDGLSNKLSDDEMKTILNGEDSIDEMVHKFVKLANEYGGEDNITVALVQYPLNKEQGDEK